MRKLILIFLFLFFINNETGMEPKKELGIVYEYNIHENIVYKSIEDIQFRKIVNLFYTIKKYEDLRLYPYKLGGQWYIGYGHHILKNELYLFRGITEDIADSLFYVDFMSKYNFWAKTGIDYDYLLLLSALSYNIGEYKLYKKKIYFYAINNNKEKFIKEYLKYSNFNGKKHKRLLKRRMEEIKSVFDNYEFLYK